MTSEEYIKDRVEGQINWFNKKSKTNKLYFLSFTTAQVVLAALIPLLTGFISETNYFQHIIGVVGVIIAVISGVMMTFKFQEKWKQYRMTSEQLNREKILFQTKTGQYTTEGNSDRRLVTSVETILSEEANSWKELMKSEETE